VGEHRLEFVQRLLGLDSLGEALVLLQEPVEVQALFAEPRNEAAQGDKAPNTFWTPLRSRIGPIQSKAKTFQGWA
jgi:hypothetical protein